MNDADAKVAYVRNLALNMLSQNQAERTDVLLIAAIEMSVLIIKASNACSTLEAQDKLIALLSLMRESEK